MQYYIDFVIVRIYNPNNVPEKNSWNIDRIDIKENLLLKCVWFVDEDVYYLTGSQLLLDIFITK